MAKAVHLRDEQQLMNSWGKLRPTQKNLIKYRRNEAAKKIQTMFKKTRKSRKKQGKILSSKRQGKADKYRSQMEKVLETMDVGLSPEEIEFQDEMAGVAKAKNILNASEYNPRKFNSDQTNRFQYNNSRRLTAKQKMAAAERNLKVHRSYLDKKKSNLTKKERDKGIKEIARRMEDNKKPYRYSAKEGTTSDDFKPKPKKKGFFENLFSPGKKGGRRTRKKRKRKRTRKKRKRRRRRTRK